MPVNKIVVHADYEKCDNREQPIFWIHEKPSEAGYHQTGKDGHEVPMSWPISASKRFVAFFAVENFDIPHGGHVGKDKCGCDKI